MEHPPSATGFCFKNQRTPKYLFKLFCSEKRLEALSVVSLSRIMNKNKNCHHRHIILIPTYYYNIFFLIILSSYTATTTQCFNIIRSNSNPTTFQHRSLSSSLTASFSKIVEENVIHKFGLESTERVRESWDLLNKDYEHAEYLGKKNDDDISSIPESASNFYQKAHSYVPGLTARTFWDAEKYDWCQKLESSFPTIRNEFLRAINNLESNDLEAKGNNIWAPMVDESAMSYGKDWRTLVLMDRGVWDRTNCAFFPETAKAVRDCSIPATEVFFASMQPNSTIKMHSDMVNFVLTSHLPLVIPQNGQNKCRLTVGDDTRQWIDGKVLMFDTSILHDAINDTNDMRYVLMLRVWHPELTDIECQALRYTFDCLSHPDLTSLDEERKFIAEQQVDAWHSFPEDLVSQSKTTTKMTKNRKSKNKSKIKRTGGGKGFGSKN